MSETIGLFTCVTCHVAFRDAENQRLHFQTEWHTYNLKRKVAQMKPVTLQEFQTKVQVHKSKTKQEEDSLTYSASCTICSKTYSSKNAYENHLKSKKHQENATSSANAEELKETKVKSKGRKGPSQPAVTENPNTVQIEDEDMFQSSLKSEKQENEQQSELTAEEEENKEIDERIANARRLKLEECLFCLHESDSLESNIEHMAKAHSFFIPDIEYVTDLLGLVTYLGEKVSVGNVCLYCNDRGKSFRSLEAVQKHMIDKSHCKIWYENDAELEFEDFYDFTTSYPDHGEHDPEEEISGTEYSLRIENLEMVLPNGSKVGHRALRAFYRQRFKGDDTRDSAIVSKIMSQYRALGWHETPENSISSEKKKLLRLQQKKDMELGVRANGLYRHLRKQVMC